MTIVTGDLVHFRESQNKKWVEEPSIIPNVSEFVLLVLGKESKVIQSRTSVEENDLVKFYNMPSFDLARGVRAELVYKGFKFDFYFDSWVDGYYWTYLFSNIYQLQGENWSLINSFTHYSESFTKDEWHTFEANISTNKNFPELFKVEFGIQSYSINSLHYCVRLNDVYLLKNDDTYELIINGDFENGNFSGWGYSMPTYPGYATHPEVVDIGSPQNYVCRVQQCRLAASPNYMRIWNPADYLTICQLDGTFNWQVPGTPTLLYTCTVWGIEANGGSIDMTWSDERGTYIDGDIWVTLNDVEISLWHLSYQEWKDRLLNFWGYPGDTIKIWAGATEYGYCSVYVRNLLIKGLYG